MGRHQNATDLNRLAAAEMVPAHAKRLLDAWVAAARQLAELAAKPTATTADALAAVAEISRHEAQIEQLRNELLEVCHLGGESLTHIADRLAIKPQTARKWAAGGWGAQRGKPLVRDASRRDGWWPAPETVPVASVVVEDAVNEAVYGTTSGNATGGSP